MSYLLELFRFEHSFGSRAGREAVYLQRKTQFQAYVGRKQGSDGRYFQSPNALVIMLDINPSAPLLLSLRVAGLATFFPLYWGWGWRGQSPAEEEHYAREWMPFAPFPWFCRPLCWDTT